MDSPKINIFDTIRKMEAEQLKEKTLENPHHKAMEKEALMILDMIQDRYPEIIKTNFLLKLQDIISNLAYEVELCKQGKYGSDEAESEAEAESD
jgi:hypothetical protein